MSTPTRRTNSSSGGAQALAVVAIVLIACAALVLALIAVTQDPGTGPRGQQGPAGAPGTPGKAGAPGTPGEAGAGIQPGTVILSPGSGGCPVGTQALDPPSFVRATNGTRLELCQAVGAG